MKCYAFVVGGLPDPVMHPRKAKQVAKYLKKEMDGMIGIHIYDRYHTFLVFWDLNDAKRARNKFRATGNQAGNNIMECELSDDNQTLDVGKVAEG